MRPVRRIASLSVLLLLAATAQGQSWPSKPIRVVVPQAPGGGSDLVARLMSPEIEKRLGQPFVIENKPGGNDSIGPDVVAKAAPDGYTIGVISSSLSINQTSAGIKLPFDPVRDLVPVAPMVRIPMVVMVNTELGVNDLKSMVAVSRARPGKLNYGSAGPTTFGGMATEWLMRLSGADYTGVTYGGRGILQGLVAGDIHLVFGGLAAATPTLQTGKAKIIAVTSAQRMTKLPDVPAVAETFPGYEVVIYYGFVAPAGTPPDIVNRLNAAIGESIQALTPKLLDMGNEPMRMAPADFKGYLARDLATWTKVVDLVK
ncbi:MAG: tripartite tricarboxylate transporter substrate-binding protein [Rhodoferax sp.]|jgi:tripartite-type tricarboxylate transporter receptor subunit TctC|nr:tripartite tricarboxylate transporter substrate binding protein [Rhodoferax sp.]